MLNINPPFGYREIKPLNRADHVRLLKSGELPAFARESQVVPLSYGEIPLAAQHYPIVFLQDAPDEQYVTAALLGLTHNHNTFGDATGWDRKAYVPGYVRRYPFCMATVTLDSQPDSDLLVCVESSQACNEPADDAVTLFDTDGQPTPQWSGIEAFLKAYESDLAIGRAFTKRLSELDLLRPFTANIQLHDGRQFAVAGMARVDEAQLAELDDATIAELHRSGYLGRIHVHLFSLQRFYDLLEREAAQGIFPLGPDVAGDTDSQTLN
ncbi:SapC family protein [Pseudomonas lini]